MSGHHIKKKVLPTLIFEPRGGEKLYRQLLYHSMHTCEPLLMEIVILCRSHVELFPLPFHTNPMESRHEHTFLAQNPNKKEKQKIHDFQRKKGGVVF